MPLPPGAAQGWATSFGTAHAMGTTKPVPSPRHGTSIHPTPTAIMKRTVTTATLAIGMMAWIHLVQPARSQGSPGPVEFEDSPSSPKPPTVPGTGVGGPDAVELGKPKADSIGEEGAIRRDAVPLAEIVAGAENFTTLAGAIRAAGLEERLKQEGPITVLAPDNNAFTSLPEGVLPLLMKPENQNLLKTILTYHLIPRKVGSSELVPGAYVTVQGEPLSVVGGSEGKMTIQGASFGTTDVKAKNGVLHVVRAVLIPPSISIEDLRPAGETEE